MDWLLNALPTAPCHPTPPQALQAGLAELRGWVAYVGGEWCCGPEEAEAAIERVTQAARFLVQVRAAVACGQPSHGSWNELLAAELQPIICNHVSRRA